MRLAVAAVGRMRRGPERDLFDDYAGRLDRTGRLIGLGPLREIEVEDRKGGGPASEAALLDAAVPRGAIVCALDERGRQLSSRDFAGTLADWRDRGEAEVVFAIGGADGLDAGFAGRAGLMLSLGSMVWPHMLARVLLAEQLYRAASILSGHPYHRD